jgi:hypothetical protein
MSRHTKNKKNLIAKEHSEIQELFMIKYEDLENLVNTTHHQLQNLNSRVKIQNECGKIAVILYTILVDSSDNKSFLNQLRYKSSIRFFESKKPREFELKLPDGKMKVIENQYFNTGDELYVLTGFSNLCTFVDDKAIPIGFNFEFIKTPPNRYLTRPVFEKIQRQEIINYFRNIFNSHSGFEINKKFDNKNFALLSATFHDGKLNDDPFEDIKFTHTLEAALVQIGIEVLASIKEFLFMQNKLLQSNHAYSSKKLIEIIS